jgi:hypothetical protein
MGTSSLPENIPLEAIAQATGLSHYFQNDDRRDSVPAIVHSLNIEGDNRAASQNTFKQKRRDSAFSIPTSALFLCSYHSFDDRGTSGASKGWMGDRASFVVQSDRSSDTIGDRSGKTIGVAIGLNS